MTTVIESSLDQVEAGRNDGVFPVPPEVKADNEAQAAKKGAKAEPKPAAVVEDKPVVETVEEQAKKEVDALDDVEGEDGLTPRQKRDFTKAMLSTIAKKHRAQREAEEFATTQYNERQLAEGRAESLARENARLKEQTKPAPAAEAKAPERKDFETDQAYQDAVIDFRVDQKLKVKAAEDAQRASEQRQSEVISQANARLERARELVPDFTEVTDAVDLKVPEYIAAYMQRSPLFAEIGYHLAKHPEVLEHLQSLPPDEQLVEIGEIKSKLQPFAPKAKVENGAEPSQETVVIPSTETGTAPSKPRVQAPVIKPLNAGSAAQVERDPADLTSSQTITAWQKKHGVVLTARKRH